MGPTPNLFWAIQTSATLNAWNVRELLEQPRQRKPRSGHSAGRIGMMRKALAMSVFARYGSGVEAICCNASSIEPYDTEVHSCGMLSLTEDPAGNDKW